MKRERLLFAVCSALLASFVLFLAFYVRSSEVDVFVATSIGAIPTGIVLLAVTYLLRNSSLRIQLTWCCFSMILIRSVQVWSAGIDFRDELRFINYSQTLFQQGQFLGYLRYYPVNIPFAAIFYGMFSVWRDPEVFEALAFFVYPLLIFGYYYVVRQLLRIRQYSETVHSFVPAILFLPFAPIFSLIPTYYWPQLLGLVVLFFAVGSLLRLLSCTVEDSRRCLIVAVGLSVVLVFTHSVSSALYVLTIPFLYWACEDKGKKRALIFIEFLTILLFLFAHYQQYWPIWQQLILALFGDAAAWQRIESYSFPDIGSIGRQGIFMTVAHTGFFLVVGVLVLWRLVGPVKRAFQSSKNTNSRLSGLANFPIHVLRTDPVVSSFVVLGVLAFASAAFFGGNFLDPVRIIGWISLFALPIVIPKNRSGALALVIVLLFLFFLLVWTVNSPWGSPIGSSINLNND